MFVHVCWFIFTADHSAQSSPLIPALLGQTGLGADHVNRIEQISQDTGQAARNTRSSSKMQKILFSLDADEI